MTQPDDEFGEFVRLSLRAAVESVVVGPDGLDRIRARLAAMRTASALACQEQAGPPGRGWRLRHGWADHLSAAD
jgi:hypothetical protein